MNILWCKCQIRHSVCQLWHQSNSLIQTTKAFKALVCMPTLALWSILRSHARSNWLHFLGETFFAKTVLPQTPFQKTLVGCSKRLLTLTCLPASGWPIFWMFRWSVEKLVVHSFSPSSKHPKKHGRVLLHARTKPIKVFAGGFRGVVFFLKRTPLRFYLLILALCFWSSLQF